MIELTEEQRQELDRPEPLVLDPHTKKTYVLVSREAYERMKMLLGDETLYTTAEMLDKVMAEDDAKDPYLADLQKLYGGISG